MHNYKRGVMHVCGFGGGGGGCGGAQHRVRLPQLPFASLRHLGWVQVLG